LIHDPRAKRGPQTEKKKKPAFASGVLVGSMAAIIVVATGVLVGLYVVRSQQAELDAKRLIAEEAASAALAAVAAASAAAPPAQPATPPSASAAPPAASSASAQPEEKPPDAGAAASASASALAVPAVPAVPPPAPVYRRPTRKPAKKFVPDDI
jgi:hypothetical protein